MKKIPVIMLCLTAVFALQNCSSSKKATAKADAVTFNKDVMPVLQASCTPCHFPPDGKKEALNSYEAVKKNIDDMIVRVSLPETDNRFMPWKGKKPALTPEAIKILKDWKDQNMPQ